MNSEMHQLLKQMETVSPASEEALQCLTAYFQATFHAVIPEDYVEFLRVSNGGVGQGPDLFVIIASAENVVEKEKGYGQDSNEKDLFLIGSDGCGNTLGIDTRSKNPKAMTYLLFDPIGLDNLDDRYAVRAREGSFLGLLVRVSSFPRGNEQLEPKKA